jgi:hypothetical protein
MNAKDKDAGLKKVTMGGHDKSWGVIGYWGMCRRGVDRVNGSHDRLCCVCGMAMLMAGGTTGGGRVIGRHGTVTHHGDD